MDKRYQVFVSSTFQDLQEERQEIMQALLELKCIPSGMELFPAANDDQWTLIKKVIDDCDYYIVVIAGRYGSTGADGISYTEMEYRYALDRRIPIIGFLHKNPASLPFERSESNPENQQSLQRFRELVKQKTCREWDSPADLGGKVSRSLIQLISNNPAIGWVRGNQVDENASAEILRLRKTIEELEATIRAARETPPTGAEKLAQGDEVFQIKYSITTESPKPNDFFGRSDEKIYLEKFDASWSDIFSAIAPLMIDEAIDEKLERGVGDFIFERNIDHIKKTPRSSEEKVKSLTINDQDFQTIKVQLRALGLITKSERTRSVKDTGTYWSLTPYGDTVMTRLRAIRRVPD